MVDNPAAPATPSISHAAARYRAKAYALYLNAKIEADPREWLDLVRRMETLVRLAVELELHKDRGWAAFRERWSVHHPEQDGPEPYSWIPRPRPTT